MSGDYIDMNRTSDEVTKLNKLAENNPGEFYKYLDKGKMEVVYDESGQPKYCRIEYLDDLKHHVIISLWEKKLFRESDYGYYDAGIPETLYNQIKEYMMVKIEGYAEY